MYIKQHALRDFRNIESLAFNPGRGVNVVCGKNGQGKTNLLESLFLLSGARSFRGAKDADLIRWGCAAANVKTEFFAAGRDQNIALTISENGREASLNRGTPQKASALAGTLCCVVFSPEHLSLVKGTPALRRRLLDTSLCQLYPSYLAEWRRYTRLITQKNNLLKSAGHVSAAHDMLDIFDAQLALSAAALSRARIDYVAALMPRAAAIYADISAGAEAFAGSYSSGLFGESEPDETAALEALARARADDLRAGHSTLGPHRDDLVFDIAAQNARMFASQGQQRTAVLALKLAESEMFLNVTGERPLLLLDDVLSELDESRRGYLLNSLGDTQAVVTGCEPGLLSQKSGAEVFYMEAGALVDERGG